MSLRHLVFRMEWGMFTLILVALVGSHAVPITKPLESISSDSLATDEDKPVNTVNNATVTASAKSCSGLQTDCEGICQRCNATAKLEKDGSCTCLSENGGEVECVHFPRYKKDLKQSSEGPGIGTEKGKDTEREQRCLGVLGSSKDTDPAPANSLQDILGNGLLNMSPVDRAKEFRKRVDALQAITVANIKNALEKAPAVKTEFRTVPGLEIPPLPKTTSLTIPPIIGKPIEEVLGKAKEEASVLAKEGEMIQTQKPVDDPKADDQSKASVNFNTPDFTFRTQIPLVQSGSGIYNPSGRLNLRLPQMTANFLPQQLRTQQTNFGSYGNYRRDGRALRSSGPFVYVQSPIVPNPSIAYDSLQSSSTDEIPHIAQEQLSPENTPQDSSESKSTMSQGVSSTNSHFSPADFTRNIFNVAGGDLTDVGKLVDAAGAEKGIGSMVQGLIEFPKEDKVTGDTSKDIASNTE